MHSRVSRSWRYWRVFLVLQLEHAEGILQTGYMHYANIVVLFRAVAIPAHMIERSVGFKWVAAYLGYQLGKIRLSYPRLATPLFDEGHVVEVGPYEELVERGGVFTELVRSAGDGHPTAA